MIRLGASENKGYLCRDTGASPPFVPSATWLSLLMLSSTFPRQNCLHIAETVTLAERTMPHLTQWLLPPSQRNDDAAPDATKM